MKAWGRFAVAGSEWNDEWWHSSKLQIAVSVSLQPASSCFAATRLFRFLLKIACACQAFYIGKKWEMEAEREWVGVVVGGGCRCTLGGGGQLAVEHVWLPLLLPFVLMLLDLSSRLTSSPLRSAHMEISQVFFQIGPGEERSTVLSTSVTSL